jgi:hypothetical protein
MEHDDLSQATPSTAKGETHDISGLLTPEPEIIDRLGKLLAGRKLLPFFGAGISTSYLGFGSKELAQEMATRLGLPPVTPLAEVADQFEQQFGLQVLAEYLASRLQPGGYDDSKAAIHRQLLSLAPDILYTTNQDNIFEQASQAYGRSYKAVVTPADLREASLDEPILIKFHGDPRVPESLVFSARSYQERMAAVDHPLDVQLKADLFRHQVLFLGYSLKDENIGKIMASVKHALGDKMFSAYVLAYEYDPEMERLHDAYGVEIIDPQDLVNPGLDVPTAFEAVMKGLCDATTRHQVNRGIEALFANDVINVVILTDYELGGLERLVPSASFESAMAAFRGHVDATCIPGLLKSRVMELFLKLLDRADPANNGHVDELKFSLSHLDLGGDMQLEAVSSFMALCNRRPAQAGYDELSSLPFANFEDKFTPFAAALAVHKITKNGGEVTEAFRNPASVWFQGYQGLDPVMREAVEAAMEIAWAGPAAARSPAKRPATRPKGVKEIADRMMASMPKGGKL